MLKITESIKTTPGGGVNPSKISRNSTFLRHPDKKREVCRCGTVIANLSPSVIANEVKQSRQTTGMSSSALAGDPESRRRHPEFISGSINPTIWTLRQAQSDKRLSSGRSLLEMLGVVAIMGVLTVGGLKGFQYALNRHAANQHLNDAITAYTKVMHMRKIPNKGEIKNLRLKTATGKQMQYYGAPGYAYIVMPTVEADVCKQLLEMKPSNLKGIVDTNDTAITAETCESNPDLYFKFALQTIVTPQADEEAGGSEDTDGTTTDTCATPPSCGLNECCRYLNTKDSCGNYQVQTGSTETRYYLNEAGCIESRSVCEFDRFYAGETTNQSALTETCDGECENGKCVDFCLSSHYTKPSCNNECCALTGANDECGNPTPQNGTLDKTYYTLNANGCLEEHTDGCSLISYETPTQTCEGTCQNGKCQIDYTGKDCDDNSDCGGTGSGYFCAFDNPTGCGDEGAGKCALVSRYTYDETTDKNWRLSTSTDSSSGRMNWWNAQNWCNAQSGFRLATLADVECSYANDCSGSTIVYNEGSVFAQEGEAFTSSNYAWLDDYGNSCSAYLVFLYSGDVNYGGRNGNYNRTALCVRR